MGSVAAWACVPTDRRVTGHAPSSLSGAFRTARVRSGRARWLAFATLLALGCAAWPGPVQAANGVSTRALPTQASQLGPVRIHALGYSLSIPGRGATLTVKTSRGSFRMPIVALIGRSAVPTGSTFRTVGQGSTITVTAFLPDGRPFEVATVNSWPRFFTVAFQSQLGANPSLEPAFFDSGKRGLPVTGSRSGFTPDPIGLARVANPTSYLGFAKSTHSAPFSPPALDLEGRTSAGWVGFGMTQMPDATTMTLDPDDGILVNYPLRVVSTFADGGAGGKVRPPAALPRPAGGRWLSFPSFAVTIAGNPLNGLVAYRQALGSLQLAPVAAPPGKRPGWWSWPLADTWGQQEVTGAARTSAAYTAAWVRGFAKSWRERFGLRHFTVVIDSQWQAHFGSARPSARFGGVSGMRRLIRELHQAGLRVMLWWPLWIRQPVVGVRKVVDPTAVSFPATIRRQMAIALGSGRHDLGADGLKLDWGDLVPAPANAHFARPSLGLGAAALLRYMSLLSRAAWQANPHALIDGSAVAPQFGGTEDAIRLYDAHLVSTWDARAILVSALDPNTLIDGDGWRLDAAQAVTHIVSSAVYGIPAIYYSTTWSGGTTIVPDFGRDLGSLLALAQGRGQGVAVPTGSGGWKYIVRGRITARTVDQNRGLIVFHYAARGGGVKASLITMGLGAVGLQLAPGWAPAGGATQGGHPIRLTRQGSALKVWSHGSATIRLRFTLAQPRPGPALTRLASF